MRRPSFAGLLSLLFIDKAFVRVMWYCLAVVLCVKKRI